MGWGWHMPVKPATGAWRQEEQKFREEFCAISFTLELTEAVTVCISLGHQHSIMDWRGIKSPQPSPRNDRQLTISGRVRGLLHW